MQDEKPFFRAAGTGPGVVCIHSNASSSSQWRALMERLSGQFHLLAPDSLNAGKSRLWQQNQPVTLADEAGFLEPVFAAVGDPFCMVGHS